MTQTSLFTFAINKKRASYEGYKQTKHVKSVTHLFYKVNIYLFKKIRNREKFGARVGMGPQVALT